MQRSIVVGHHMKVTRAIKQAEAQGKFLPIAETNTSSQESHDWVTISSTIEAPPFEIVDLKAGLKYQCRVRHRIAGENWIEWDKCVFSDIFSMAATAPEPPFEVRAAFIDKISDPLQHAQSSAAELEVNSHVGDIINDTDSLQHESTNTAVKAENLISNQQESNHIEIPASLILADPDTFEDCYDLFKDNIDVTHDSIVITWKNGVTNGMPIVEHEIECARVRNHYINEVEAARDAFYNEEKEETIPRLNSGSFSPHIARYGVRSPASPLIPFANTNLVAYDPNEFEVRHSPLSPKRLAKGDEERIVLRWQNITHEGEFINAQAFRAKGLVPGSSYVFRVRQRNEKGWSKFSQSSKLIPTFPTAPPSAPTVLSESSGSTYLTVSWYQEKDSGVALTVLGYEVQTGKNEPSGQQLHMKSDASGISDLVSANEMLNWETATTKEVKGQADGSIVVMVEHLTPSTHYCVRVRIRTVAGWSPWSSHSNVWKTQGQ